MRTVCSVATVLPAFSVFSFPRVSQILSCLNDDQVDAMFGAYLRTHRVYARLSVEQVALVCRIPVARWHALEAGTALVGVRPSECRRIASVLCLPVGEVLTQAGGPQ